jgi:hypothetical protein
MRDFNARTFLILRYLKIGYTPCTNASPKDFVQSISPAYAESYLSIWAIKSMLKKMPVFSKVGVKFDVK